MSKRKRNNSNTSPDRDASKRIKLDENDIDFLIGDLRKEEAQLVLTRLLRKNATIEDELRKQIEVVRHARAQLSAEQINTQIQNLQQLRILQSMTSPTVAGGSPFAGGNIPAFDLQSPYASPAPAKGLSAARLKGVKNRIRDSFKKAHSGKYTINGEIIEREIVKVKEFAEKNQLQRALQLLEAITEEFVDRGSQLSTSNVTNYKTELAQLSEYWLDLFLNDNLKLDEDAREEWSEKMRSWDTSAEEEGVLSCARSAAKLGWEDSNLVKVIKGEFNIDDEEGPHKQFSEPANLTVARLNTLEREKRFEEALNLANAVGMYQHAAKFLMKLNKTDEAIAVAMKLETDASAMFSIATIARPINVSASFTLAIKAIASSSIVSPNNGWSTENMERASWICDLAITEKILDNLITQVTAVIVDKNVQFQIAKLLLARGKIEEAIKLGKLVLKKYDLEKLNELWQRKINYQKEQRAKANQLWEEPETPTSEKQYLAQFPFAVVPYSLTDWLWDVTYQNYVAVTNQDLTKMHQLLDTILALVDDTSRLTNLMNIMLRNSQFAEIDKVGRVVVKLINAQQKVDKEFQENLVKARLAHQENADKQLKENGITIPAFEPPVAEHSIYNFDQSKMQACQLMLTAALTNKAQYLPKDEDEEQQQQQEPEMSEEERTAKLNACDKVIEGVVDLSIIMIPNPNNLLRLASVDMSNKQEYKLSLKICAKAAKQVEALDKEREERETWQAEFTTLNDDVNAMIAQKLTPSTEQVARLKELQLRNHLLQLEPAYRRSYSESQYDKLFSDIARAMLLAAVNSKTSLIPSERLSNTEIEQIALDAFKILSSPAAMQQLVDTCSSLGESNLVLHTGKITIDKIKQLRSSLQSRLLLQTEISLLEEEERDLQANYKKELDEEQKSRLEQLRGQLDSLPAAKYYESNSIDSYNSSIYSLINSRMLAILRAREMVTQAIDNPSLDDSPERMNSLKEQLKEISERVPVVFKESVAELESPPQLAQLISTLTAQGEVSFVIEVGKKAHKLLFQLETERKRRVEPTLELQELQAEKAAIWDQHKHRQQLPTEKLAKIRQLQLQKTLWQKMPAYTSWDANNIGRSIRDIGVAMASAVNQQKANFVSKLYNAQNTANPDNPMHLNQPPVVVEAKIKSATEEAERMIQELAALEEVTDKLIEHCSSVIVGPASVQKIANLVQLPSHDIYEHKDRALTQRSKLCTCIFGKVSSLNELRKKNSELMQKRDALQQEKEELLALKTPFPSEKQKELDDFNRQLSIQSKEASYYRLSSDKLEEHAYNAANLMLTSISNQINSLSTQKEALEAELRAAEGSSSADISNDEDKMDTNEDSASNALQEKEETEHKIAGFDKRIKALTILLNASLNVALQHVRNPKDLYKIGNGLQTKHTLSSCATISEKAFKTIAELREQFNERQSTIEELASLESEYQELLSVGKTMKDAGQKKKLLELRHQNYFWNLEPAYTRANEYDLDTCEKHIASMQCTSLINHKSSLKSAVSFEEQARLQKIESIRLDDSKKGTKISHSTVPKSKYQLSLEKEIQAINKQISAWVTKICGILHDPQHFVDIANLFSTYAEHDSVMTIVTKCQDLVLKLDKLRQQHAETEKKYFVILTERYTLEQKNEKLDSKRMKELQAVFKQAKELEPLRFGVTQQPEHGEDLPEASDYPEDTSAGFNNSVLDKIITGNGTRMMSAILDKIKLYEDDLAKTAEMLGEDAAITKDVEKQRKQHEKQLQAAIKFCLSTIDNISGISSLVSSMISRKEYDLIFNFGVPYLERLATLRAHKNDVVAAEEKRLTELKEEERQLQQHRKSLEKKLAIELRDLHMKKELRRVLPSYKTKSNYDTSALSVYKKLLKEVFRFKKAQEEEQAQLLRNPHLIRGRSMSAEEIAEAQKSSDNTVAAKMTMVIELAIKYITEVSHLIEIVNNLVKEEEHEQLINLGNHTQKLLREQLKIRIVYEALNKRLHELRAKLPMANSTPTPEIIEAEEQLAQLENLIKYDIATLRNWILEIADNLIDIARLEKKDDIVRDQSILVFKMTMQPAKFDEVKTLVSETEWNEIREDLLNYVKSYDTTLPGSAIDTKTQMQLLLQEGLWKDAIAICPEPPSEYDISNPGLQILELLWYEVERICPAELKKLLDLIEKYAKKEFQQFNIDTMDKLLDSVQTRFPDFIAPLYNQASSILISNITNKQYTKYVSFVKIVKRRLVDDLKRDAEWTTFIAAVRKSQGRKKKLIQQMDVADLK